MAKDEIAYKCLKDVETIPPAPPWNTGALRNSGAAYVGSRLVATTSGWGQNPNGPAVKVRRVRGRDARGRFSSKIVGGLSRGSVDVDFLPSQLGYISKKSLGTSVIDTITLIYHHPVAALMHEWSGGFSPATPPAGPHYISSKFDSFGRNFREVLMSVFS